MSPLNRDPILRKVLARTELATVEVAEVDFHSGKCAAKPLQKPIYFASNELDHSRIYRYVLSLLS